MHCATRPIGAFREHSKRPVRQLPDPTVIYFQKDSLLTHIFPAPFLTKFSWRILLPEYHNIYNLQQ